MIIEVTEKCLTVDNNDKEYYALRHYQYETSATSFLEAIIELETNFELDNIIEKTSHDEFDGECLDSQVVKVEIVE